MPSSRRRSVSGPPAAPRHRERVVLLLAELVLAVFLLRSLPSMLAHLLREPARRPVSFHPRCATPCRSEREWRAEVQPRYRAEMAEADAQVETMPLAELPALIDHLADLAGEYFMWVAAPAARPTSWRSTSPASTADTSRPPWAEAISRCCPASKRRRTPAATPSSPSTGGTSRPWPWSSRRRAITTAWWRPSRGRGSGVCRSRRVAEAARCVPGPPGRSATPGADPRRADPRMDPPVAGHAASGGPNGEALAARGVLPDTDDVFFLTRDELLAALRGEPLGPAVDVAGRRAARAEQARLVPPFFVGNVNRAFRAMPGAFARMVGRYPARRPSSPVRRPPGPGHGDGPHRPRPE